MNSALLGEEGPQLLSPAVFQFVLKGELRRAARGQNFVTLVVLDTRREWAGRMVAADDALVRTVAQIVGTEVRETDLLGHAKRGVLGILLLDANLDHSHHVIDRLVSRIGSHEFSAVLRIAIGAACCPTHAVDAAALERRAISHFTVNWRTPARASADQN